MAHKWQKSLKIRKKSFFMEINLHNSEIYGTFAENFKTHGKL